MPSFGERLRREREKRSISLEDVSATTKISVRLLRALEEDHFDLLPGGIFNKGFVRSYARHLGLDEDAIVAEYLVAAGESAPATQPADEIFPIQVHEEQPAKTPSAAQIPWGVVAILLLLVAVGFAGWGYYSRQAPRSQAVPAPTVAHSAVAAPTTLQTEPATAVSNSAPEPVVTPALPPAETTAPAFTVAIKAEDDSWISIAADGKQVVSETMVAPAERTVSANSRISVRAGNVGALAFWFNGKPLPLQGEDGEARTLVFSPNGLEAGARIAPRPTPVSQPIH